MEITDGDVAKFRQIWREEFKEEIREDAARIRIRELDALYRLLLQRSPQENEAAEER